MVTSASTKMTLCPMVFIFLIKQSHIVSSTHTPTHTLTHGVVRAKVTHILEARVPALYARDLSQSKNTQISGLQRGLPTLFPGPMHVSLLVTKYS